MRWSRRIPRSVVCLCLAAVLSAWDIACGGGGGGGSSTPAPTAPTVVQWQLQGVVTDSATDSRLNGARVEVLDGADAGRAVTTDPTGSYRLTALKQGGFTVKVTKPGYLAVSQSVTLTADTTTNFGLTQDSPKVAADFEPPTLTANPSGNPTYPNELRFILYVRETNFVDVTVKAIVYRIVTTAGETGTWTYGTDELLKYYDPLLVTGGSWKVFRPWLIYSGQRQGVLTVTVETTDAKGERHTATATANVVPPTTASGGAGMALAFTDSRMTPKIPDSRTPGNGSRR